MSLSNDELTALMAYVDGEVDDRERASVEALLARGDEASDEARQVVAQLGALGDWVRSSEDERAERAKADGIADSVMGEVERLGGPKVISFERERARRAVTRQRFKELGAILAVAAVFALIWAWPGQSHGPHPVGGAGGATMAANERSVDPKGDPNGLKTDPNGEPKGPSYPAPMPRPPEKSPGAVAEATSGNLPIIPPESGEALAVGSEEGVDIENVESPHQVSVFYLPVTNKNAASVVVWIGEPTEEAH